MARAFLSLYTATADRRWLDQARQTAAFIGTRFAYQSEGQPIGFAATSNGAQSPLPPPLPDFDENVSLARFTNLLFHYTGDHRDQEMAETAYRFCGPPILSKAGFRLWAVSSSLKRELRTDPLHVTVVGPKNDALAQKLFDTAFFFPCFYRQLEWIDNASSSAATQSISYPHLSKSAAYLCTSNTCSAPVFAPEKLTRLIQSRTSP